MDQQALPAGTDVAAPIPPTPPAFNPLDPVSITWYVTAIVTAVGFILHKDLNNVVGPVALGVFALVGVAISVIHAIKSGTYTKALMQYNAARIDHYATVSKPRELRALNDAMAATLTGVEGDINHLADRLTVVEQATAKAEKTPAQIVTRKRTPAKKTARRRSQPPVY